MPNEGSVAPKERVNITYKTDLNGVEEQKELPLKLLFLGDFTGRPDETPLEEREPDIVDKNNFNDVMKAKKLQLTFSVPDKISEVEGEEFQVDLSFENLKDFEPDSIVQKFEPLRKIHELRSEIQELKNPILEDRNLRNMMEKFLKDDKTRAMLRKELGLDTEAGEGA